MLCSAQANSALSSFGVHCPQVICALLCFDLLCSALPCCADLCSAQPHCALLGMLCWRRFPLQCLALFCSMLQSKYWDYSGFALPCTSSPCFATLYTALLCSTLSRAAHLCPTPRCSFGSVMPRSAGQLRLLCLCFTLFCPFCSGLLINSGYSASAQPSTIALPCATSFCSILLNSTLLRFALLCYTLPYSALPSLTTHKPRSEENNLKPKKQACVCAGAAMMPGA